MLFFRGVTWQNPFETETEWNEYIMIMYPAQKKIANPALG